MEKEYFRFLIKDHYDNPNDLVSRRLNRAIRKINDNFSNIISNNGVYVYIYKLNNNFYEFFTGEQINENILLEKVEIDTILNMLDSLKESQAYYKMYFLIEKLLFNRNYSISFIEVSTMEEKASDRYQLFNEYNNDLTDINPYSSEYRENYDDVKIKKLYYKLTG